ncbi:unnamed protein product [Orchesella dallaii]|uniref:Uncharacterized protein n=1 Tax=Orchesella dallaii TaxID=48710 RepID=A0ABP1QEL2_9HEXA
MTRWIRWKSCGSGRIYLKANFAEEITAKENKVAETVRLLDIGPAFYDTKFTKLQQNNIPAIRRLEISFITDPIISKPTRIVLSNSIQLKPSLIVGLFQHVSTYAVALIQFDSVQNSYTDI